MTSHIDQNMQTMSSQYQPQLIYHQELSLKFILEDISNMHSDATAYGRGLSLRPF